MLVRMLYLPRSLGRRKRGHSQQPWAITWKLPRRGSQIHSLTALLMLEKVSMVKMRFWHRGISYG